MSKFRQIQTTINKDFQQIKNSIMYYNILIMSKQLMV